MDKKNISYLSFLFFHIVLYGILPLIMPYIYFTILAIIWLPISIVLEPTGLLETYGDLGFLITRILLFVILLIGYIFLSLKLIKPFSRKAIIFFTVFIPSSIINFFWSYFICAISVLRPCDPSRYLTLKGLLEIYDFYLIALISFLLANVYLKFRKSEND